MRKPFGQLSVGTEFEYAGRTFIKMDDFNARTNVSRGKESFLFFKRDLVTTKQSTKISHTDDLSNEFHPDLMNQFDQCMIESYDDYFMLKKIYRSLRNIVINAQCLNPQVPLESSIYSLSFDMNFSAFDDSNKVQMSDKFFATYYELTDWKFQLPSFNLVTHRNSEDAFLYNIPLNISFKNSILSIKNENSYPIEQKQIMIECNLSLSEDSFKTICKNGDTITIQFSPIEQNAILANIDLDGLDTHPWT